MCTGPSWSLVQEEEKLQKTASTLESSASRRGQASPDRGSPDAERWVLQRLHAKGVSSAGCAAGQASPVPWGAQGHAWWVKPSCLSQMSRGLPRKAGLLMKRTCGSSINQAPLDGTQHTVQVRGSTCAACISSPGPAAVAATAGPPPGASGKLTSFQGGQAERSPEYLHPHSVAFSDYFVDRGSWSNQRLAGPRALSDC